MKLPIILAALAINMSSPTVWDGPNKPIPYADIHISDLLLTVDDGKAEREALLKYYDIRDPKEYNEVDATATGMTKFQAVGWLLAFFTCVIGGLIGLAMLIESTYHDDDVYGHFNVDPNPPDWPSKNWHG
jgi:hypothetical protein